MRLFTQRHPKSGPVDPDRWVAPISEGNFAAAGSKDREMAPARF